MKEYNDRFAEVEILEDVLSKDAMYVGESMGTYDSVVIDYLIEVKKPKKVAKIKLFSNAFAVDQTGLGSASVSQNGRYVKEAGNDLGMSLDIYYDEASNVFLGKMNPKFNINAQAEESLAKALFSLKDSLGIRSYVDITQSSVETEDDGALMFAVTSDKAEVFSRHGMKGASFSIYSNPISSRKEHAIGQGISYSTLFTNIKMDMENVTFSSPLGTVMVPMPKARKSSEFYTTKTIEGLGELFNVPYDETVLKRVSKEGDERIAELNNIALEQIKEQIKTQFGGLLDEADLGGQQDFESEKRRRRDDSIG